MDHIGEIERYMAGVLEGTIPAGKLVKQAVTRHLRDLETAADMGIRFNPEAGLLVLQFFELLKHSKGKRHAGSDFKLAPWQQFILFVVFGWQRQDAQGNWIRRYRVAYVEIARKNGKTTLAAGIALYLLCCDGEPSGEVYSVATKRDQARIAWEEAARMVKSSPWLKGQIKTFKTSLVHEASSSKFEPLGQDADTTDGLSPSGYIVDEYHAHKSADLFNVLDSGTDARDAPLGFVITTAGEDEEGPCGQMRDYCRKILDGVVDDDAYFAFIAEPDEGDDPWDETTWAKSNPNLGISLRLEDFRQHATTAQSLPTSKSEFLRKRLNIWTRSKTLAVAMEDWNSCSDHVDEDKLAGRECYGGLDLSKRGDLTAFALLFPPVNENEKWQLLARCWIPEATVAAKEKTDRVLYSHWIETGLLIATDNDRVNYEMVRQQILADRDKFCLQQVAYDPWNAEETRQKLQGDGVNMIEFGQSIRNYNEPTQTFCRMVKSHEFAHGGNSLLKWCASNLEVKTDNNQNVRPIKPDYMKSRARIDPIVASIMALGLALKAQNLAGTTYFSVA